MFLLDANTYFEAKIRYYQMGFCPGYWDWLDQKYASGELSSILPVYDEIAAGKDDLAVWAKSRRNQFSRVTSGPIQVAMADITGYVYSMPRMNKGSVDSFLGGADPWLIATALVTNATVVTHEKLVPNDSTKVKIPNVCANYNIKYINTFALLSNLNAVFRL